MKNIFLAQWFHQDPKQPRFLGFTCVMVLPVRELSTTKLFGLPAPGGMGRELMGWDQDNLIGKEGGIKGHGAQHNCSLPDNKCPVSPWALAAPWQLPPLLLFSIFRQMVWNIPLVTGSPVLAVSPPSSWCTSSLLSGGTAQAAEKSFTLCKPCSATTKTLVCQHYPHPKSKTAPFQLLGRKLILSQPKPRQVWGLK